MGSTFEYGYFVDEIDVFSLNASYTSKPAASTGAYVQYMHANQSSFARWGPVVRKLDKLFSG